MKSDSVSEVKVPWLKGLEKSANGELFFAERPLAAAMTQSKVPLPAYFLSLEIVRSRAQAYRQILSQHLKQPLHFHFAMKSNNHPELLKMLAQEDFGVDVVSGGEFRAALGAGFKAGDVVFSGVAKSKDEITHALGLNVGQFNIESTPELLRIVDLAKKTNQRASIAIRFNPEVKAETHPYIATGFRENKFGVDALDLPEMADIILKNKDVLVFQGLSLHIGSQLQDFAALEDAIHRTLAVEAQLEARGLTSKSLDVGGGVGISYKGTEAEDHQTLLKYAQVLGQSLAGYKNELHFEPGRFWVARAGFLAANIEYVKRTPYKNFLILNVGMNALIRPMLYQAYHRIELLQTREGGPAELFDVVGPVCESSDTLGSLRLLRQPQEGDVVIIGEAGAYGAVLSSQYNLLGEVPEHIWSV
ncbi:MAG: diaminopimelate decarboxylase [Bdellovibrio sp.]|jgi:diaminopimelate decarboxylase